MNQQLKQIYRAADAALNRALEGLRVSEDAARFISGDPETAARIKALRHRAAEASKCFSLNMLINGRDIEGDKNKSLTDKNENIRRDTVSLVRANMRRAAEAVRTLEELYKMRAADGAGAEAENPYKKIRFEIYEVEKKQLTGLLKKSKTDIIYGSLYGILDSGFIKNNEYVKTAAMMIEGGARVIQLRMKNSSSKDKLAAAIEIAPLCRESGVLFIVNDDPSVALLCGADGVHLGNHDLPCAAAAGLLPAGSIIGTSNNSADAAADSVSAGASYIAAGPVFSTETKTGDILDGRGLDLIREIRQKTELPLVAIGGIDAHRAAEVVAAGADSLAVISALYSRGSIRANCEELTKIITEEYEKRQSVFNI